MTEMSHEQATSDEPTAICANCDRPIWSYVHSRMGPLEARAWTDISPDSDDDPRYGTRCPESSTGYGSHVPAQEDEA